MKVSALRALPICAAVLACYGGTAAAADGAYPTKPVRMIVGFAPGGGTDTTARALTPKLSERLGQQVIVDNRPGAAGNIATEIITKAPPDGYTILMGTIAALSINPTLYGNLPFNPLRDLAPVTQAVDSTNILVVHPTVAAKNVKELIALGKSGKQLNGGSSGVGGAGHLALELFNVMAGTKITHVPYKGGGPAMTDLLGGQINLIFATAASAIPHVNSGKIRGLAVTTSRRSKLVDLPTVAEAGLPGFEANNWYGVVVPAKTPRPIIDRLNKEFTAVLNAPDVRDMLFKQGLDVHPSTPEEFGKYIASETSKWAKVIKASGAKPE